MHKKTTTKLTIETKKDNLLSDKQRINNYISLKFLLQMLLQTKKRNEKKTIKYERTHKMIKDLFNL